MTGVGGHEAFSSILFAPKSSATFVELLQAVRAPIALLYGKQDPFIWPLFGQRVKAYCPKATYYEISPSGHCPHHEVSMQHLNPHEVRSVGALFSSFWWLVSHVLSETG